MLTERINRFLSIGVGYDVEALDLHEDNFVINPYG